MSQQNQTERDLIEGFKAVARHVDSVENAGGDLSQMAAMSATAVGLCVGRSVTTTEALEGVLADFLQSVAAIAMKEMGIRAERRSGQH